MTTETASLYKLPQLVYFHQSLHVIPVTTPQTKTSYYHCDGWVLPVAS